LPARFELNIKVSPSAEWLAHPSTAGEFTRLLEPGKLSTLTGVDHSPQFFAAALALASAIRLPATIAARALREMTLFMMCLAFVFSDAAGVETGPLMCDEGLPMIL
jgi:hypothetical protein